MTTVDLNADVGEGIQGDVALLAFVTSANVACGFHAGDESTMRGLCEAASERAVAVGAHVGYRDREGFGRRALDVAPHAVGAETAEQIAALQRIAAAAGVSVRYVKPHGALYTRAATDRPCADAVAAAAAEAGVAALLGPPGSELLAAARAAALAPVAEGFADRGYRPDGSLVPRDEPGALLAEDHAVAQGLRLARERRVESICLHGDSPGALDLARRLVEALRGAGIEPAPFT